MKKFYTIILTLCLIFTQGTYVHAETWDTNAQPSASLWIPGDDWKEMISISKIISTGAYDPKDGNNMANLVFYCSNPCKVTTLKDADITLGGSMYKVTISSNGKPVHGNSVKPTYQNKVYSEDFDAYINGKGTYWNLSEGIYYMNSVNGAHCIYIVVGDPLKEEEHVHEYRDVKTIDPTCAEKGYTLRECTKCELIERYNYIDKLPHNYETKTIEANCIKEGKTQYTCKECGYITYDNVIEALGHLWDEGHLNFKGKMVYTCIRCKDEIEKNIGEIIIRCEHKLKYTVTEEGIITQTCEKNDCDHSSSVTVSPGSTEFTGKELDAKITYDENWFGDNVEVKYYNRKGPGRMDVTISIGGVSTKITYRIIANVPLDLSKYIKSEKSTGSTLKNSQLLSNDISKLDIDKVVESMTHVSLNNATAEQKEIIKQRIIDLLTKATYRPIQYGAQIKELKKFPFQNDGPKGNSGSSIKDNGLNTTVTWQMAGRGCAAYARFFSAYVYGNDGTHANWGKKYANGTFTTYKATTDRQARDQIRTIVDPGETIQYDTGIPHKIVFLGESADSKGFYFSSYGGGKYGSKDYYEIELRYITYEGFVDMTDGVYIVRDTNGSLSKKGHTPGSYYEGDAKQVKISKNNQASIIANCPVEMIVKVDEEVLDSRLLDDGQSATVSYGTMTAIGAIGQDRQITLVVNHNLFENEHDLTLLGTADGKMNITVQQSYINEDNEKITDERKFLDVPVALNSKAEIKVSDPLSDVYLLNTYNEEQENPDLWIASPCNDAESGMYQEVSKPSAIKSSPTREDLKLLDDENDGDNNTLFIIGGSIIILILSAIIVSKKKK